MDDLLIKYILEEATPQESDQVQQWLAANAANRKHFEHLQQVWSLAAQPSLQRATDIPQALQRLKQTLKEREAAHVTRIWRLWTVAAAVVGIAGIALSAYVWMKPKTTVKEQSPVVQPDTVVQKRLRVDTLPAVQRVPALDADTVVYIKKHKKERPSTTTTAPAIHPKKTAVQQPIFPGDTIPVKKKISLSPAAQPVVDKKKTSQPIPATNTLPVKKKLSLPAQPVKKHKSLTAPAAPFEE